MAPDSQEAIARTIEGRGRASGAANPWISHIIGTAGAATGLADLTKSAICLYQAMRPGGAPWLRNRVGGNHDHAFIGGAAKELDTSEEPAAEASIWGLQ